MADESIFERANETPTNPVEQLVGEGKKYKSVEDLATAYLHADNHIREVTRDSGQTREELKSMREFIEEQFKNRTPEGERQPEASNREPPAQREAPTAPAPTPRPQPADEVDLKQRIKDALREENEETRAARNAADTEAVMVERFGSKADAAEAIRKRAVELGVSPQWIADTAFRSPNAFYATMGINPTETPRSTSTPSSTSDVNTQALDKHNPGVKPGTKAYYDNIRKTNKGLYNTAAVQNALMKDALENPNFYR